MMMMMPNGETASMTMTDPMMMKHGKKLSHTTMMVMMSGHMYMMPDMKMPNGKMMSDEMHMMQ